MRSIDLALNLTQCMKTSANMPTDATIASAALPQSAADTHPCQYCSVTAKASGEEPIGTAISARQWLFIEVPQPWAKNPWMAESAALLATFQQIERSPRLWKDLRILAIAPDRKLDRKPDQKPARSQNFVGQNSDIQNSDIQNLKQNSDQAAAAKHLSNYRHLFFYSLPTGATAAYTQQHYHLPVEQLSDLVQALVFQPTQLTHFSQYQQQTTRALFVCTHTRYDLACGRFGTPLYRLLRQQYAQPGQLSVWQTTHFGGHNFAPTLIDFPSGQFWGHLEPEVLDTLIYRKGEVTQLAPFYRGWSGFSKWAQIAERSLWMEQGWAWLTTPKAARIIRQDPGRLSHRLLRWILPWIPMIRAQVLLKKLNRKLTWAEVEICWQDQGKPAGCYRARVEKSHTVMSQMKSGKSASLVPVPQYQCRSIR